MPKVIRNKNLRSSHPYKKQANFSPHVNHDTLTKCKEKEKRIPITHIRILALQFLSDHNLLTDNNANWGGGGTLYPMLKWTFRHVVGHPVSHTKNQRVRIRILIAVSPANADPEWGMLRGFGLGGVAFMEPHFRFRGGASNITLTSQGDLPNQVRTVNFQINWNVLLDNDSNFDLGQTTNEMFVTWGDPDTMPRRPGITLRRMRYAVREVAAANSIAPHTIVNHVMTKWTPAFDLNVAHPNAWVLGDENRGPAPHPPLLGPLRGADCQTTVRFVQNIIKMVGCPGDAFFVLVWADRRTPNIPRVNLGLGPNNPQPFHMTHPSQAVFDVNGRLWEPTLVDEDGGFNRYEACLRFTHPAGSGNPIHTIYYAGGIGSRITSTHVLFDFFTMSWINGGAIYDYRANRMAVLGF